jgi:hypothetical protein
MILYTSPQGFTLTTEQLASLVYDAGQTRPQGKTDAEHAADDILWDLGWCVMSRVPPEQRATEGAPR